MQICGCNDTSNPACFTTGSSPGLAAGTAGPDNGWSLSGYSDPDLVQIPVEGSPDYNTFFGVGGTCQSSWLRLQNDPSYSQDTTVWEMPFIKPRLVK